MAAARVLPHTDSCTPDEWEAYAIPVFPVAVVHSSECTAGLVPETASRSQAKDPEVDATNPWGLHTLQVNLDKLSRSTAVAAIQACQ